MSEWEERDLERLLGRRLIPHHVPGADTTWRRIAPLLDTTPQRRPFRLVAPVAATMSVVVAVSILLLFVRSTTPSGGSPGGQAVGGGQGGQPATPAATASSTAMAVPARGSDLNILFDLRPTPPFQVLRPSYLPPGARLAAAVYNPGPPSIPTRLVGPDADATIAVATEQRVQQLLGDGQGAVLILIYAIGPDQFLEVVQRPAAASPWRVQGGVVQRTGELTPTRRGQGAFTQRDGREVLSWIDIASPPSETSFVEVLTTLGRAEAMQVANGLENIKLPTPRPTVANIVPLEERKKPVREPQASAEAIASACGPWPEAAASALLTSDLPSEARARIDCAARLVAGLSGTSTSTLSVGITRDTWRAALTHYGLTPVNDVAGDPAVWVVTAGISVTSGNIIILDAATGAPILLAEVLP